MKSPDMPGRLTPRHGRDQRAPSARFDRPLRSSADAVGSPTAPWARLGSCRVMATARGLGRCARPVHDDASGLSALRYRMHRSSAGHPADRSPELRSLAEPDLDLLALCLSIGEE